MTTESNVQTSEEPKFKAGDVRVFYNNRRVEGFVLTCVDGQGYNTVTEPPFRFSAPGVEERPSIFYNEVNVSDKEDRIVKVVYRISENPDDRHNENSEVIYENRYPYDNVTGIFVTYRNPSKPKGSQK